MTKFDEEGFKKKYLPSPTPVFQHIRPTDLGLKALKSSGNYPPLIASVFACCGARALSNMYGNYLTTKEIRQEFVSQLVRLQSKFTYYYLPTTGQIKSYLESKNSVLNILRELGGKEVHKNPNRIHGPNQMHLWVLDPGTETYKRGIDKFLVKIPTKDSFGYACSVPVPRYMVEEFGYPPYTEEPEVAAKKTSPLRDAFGRFVKRI